MIQDLAKIDSLIISLSDILDLVNADGSDNIRDLIDNLLDKKLEILEDLRSEKDGKK